MIGSVTQYQQEMLAAVKARRGERESDLVPRDEEEAEGPPLTGDCATAEAAAQDVVGAGQNVARADVGKGFRERGAVVGPGDFMEPGQPPDPGSYRRGYLDAGHAAPSPVRQSPNRNPVAGRPPGEPARITLPGTTLAGHVPAQVTTALSMGSPSDR